MPALTGGAFDGNNYVGTTQTKSKVVLETGDTITGDVMGGMGNSPQYNTVTINGGTVADSVYGGYTTSGIATNNTVTINGGNINSGGQSNKNVTAGYGSSNVMHNTMIINGGTINGQIYGGYSTGGNAEYNSLIIKGSPHFGSSAALHGGKADTGQSSNNTLYMMTSGVTVQSVQNFQLYSFALPATGDFGLKLTGSGASAGTIEATDRIAIKSVLPGKHAQGDRVLLIDGLGNADWNGRQDTISQGLLEYLCQLDASATEVGATITEIRATPQSNALTKSHSGSMAAMSLAANLVAGQGLDNAAQAAWATGASQAATDAYGFTPFSAIQGGGWYSPIGDGFRVNGAGMLAGLAKYWSGNKSGFLLGGFFETGQSRVSTKGDGVRSGSKISTLGGGLLARAEMTDTAVQGLYAEASFRTGNMHQQWHSDYSDGTGNLAEYSKNSPYYGIHAGLGYQWNMTETSNMDLYVQYFWNHQQGFDTTILGDSVHFEDVDSHMARVGARYAYAVTPQLSPYVGLAWEQEFNGKARVSVYDIDLPALSTRGGTGVIELGVKVTPKNSEFFVSLDVQGFVGQRQGALGSVSIGLTF